MQGVIIKMNPFSYLSFFPTKAKKQPTSSIIDIDTCQFVFKKIFTVWRNCRERVDPTSDKFSYYGEKLGNCKEGTFDLHLVSRRFIDLSLQIIVPRCFRISMHGRNIVFVECANVLRAAIIQIERNSLSFSGRISTTPAEVTRDSSQGEVRGRTNGNLRRSSARIYFIVSAGNDVP